MCSGQHSGEWHGLGLSPRGAAGHAWDKLTESQSYRWWWCRRLSGQCSRSRLLSRASLLTRSESFWEEPRFTETL